MSVDEIDNGSWAAIDKVCEILYPEQEPKDWGAV